MNENNIVINIKVRDENDQYPEYAKALREHFNRVVENNVALFTTDSENLFDIFLGSLPEDTRQHYTCNACRYFVNRFGGLVTIDENGNVNSALWDENIVPNFFVNIEILK